MGSSDILLENLKCHYEVSSINLLAKKINYSRSILLNWSSSRSSPNLVHLNNLAYNLGIEVSQLLIKDNKFTIDTPIWRDGIENTLKNNLGRLRLEKDIHESFFNEDYSNVLEISYRSFLRYVNGKNKRINLVALDRLSVILSTETYKLLEWETKK